MTQAVDETVESHEAPWHDAEQAKEAEYDGTSAQEHAVETKKADHTTVINNLSIGAVDDGGWVLKIHPKHNCILPTIDNQTFVGSIWKCGGCGQHWSVFEKKTENAVGVKGFKRISEEVVAKRLAKRAEDDDES